MSKRFIIFRSKVDETKVKEGDAVFTTGNRLTDILDAIKPHGDDCVIKLYGCETMVHFRATLKDNFPNASIRHSDVNLETL